MRGFGAEVVVAGSDFDQARGHARTLADKLGLRMVSPFHPDLVLGVATYAGELLGAVTDRRGDAADVVRHPQPN